MDKILSLVEELKNMILDSNEYKEYDKFKKVLDNNKEINKIISMIKEKQKLIINKETKNIDKELEEFEVKNLFEKLEDYEEYNNYVRSAKALNNLISGIQKRFTDYFSEFVL